MNGLSGVPLSPTTSSKKDFTSDVEVRWCPGCGDYSILAGFTAVLPTLGIARENTVIVSGIGCSSRFPYYVNSYGMHSIHGRATAIASGLAITRDDLAIFVATGDGDALSIGGNHFIHLLRRNLNLTVVMFNNRIYGLTKGQVSPTSEQGKITSSTPDGSVDQPFNPISLALGAEATFVARTIDSNHEHLKRVLTAAAHHRGTAFVEIYQGCPIFNRTSFEAEKTDHRVIPLEAGEPIIFDDGQRAVVRAEDGSLQEVLTDSIDPAQILTHEPTLSDPTMAFALSRLKGWTPIGIFRAVDSPTYDDAVRTQCEPYPRTTSDIQTLLCGQDSWLVH